MRRLPAIILTLLLSTLFITTTANAQLLQFGVKGGLNMTDFSGVDYDSDTRNGGHLGLSLTLNPPLLPLGVESGLYYTQKGARFMGTDPELGEIEFTYKMDYLEVPVLAKLDILPAGPVRPHILAGPWIGFAVNAESELAIDNISATEDMSDFTRPVDMGLLFGVGSDLNIGIARLSLQLRYSLGLTPALEDEFDEGEKNRALYLTVGYGF